MYRERFPEERERRVSILNAAQKLTEIGVLPEKLAEQIDELRKVRNEAVHSAGEVDVQKVKKAADALLEISTKVVGYI